MPLISSVKNSKGALVFSTNINVSNWWVISGHRPLSLNKHPKTRSNLNKHPKTRS